MASTTSQHPVPEAIDDFKQHQHGEIDPAVTSFLERRAHEIWQRTQAQPSTYVLTREEFAVVTYYRERLKDDEVVHQAVRRFWDHYNGSTPQAWDPGHLGSPEAHGVTNTHERTQVSFETREKQVESRISGKGQLTQGEHTPQTPEVHQRDSKSPENLYLDWARSVHTSNGEEYGLVNSIKIWVQSLTRESWDWWPLHPSFRRLREDEVRIKRYCASGRAHWTVLSKTELALSLEALRRKATGRPAFSERKKPTLPSEGHLSASTSTSRSSESEVSGRNSSPATSEGDSSDQPDDESNSRKNHDAPGAGTAVEIVPLSNLNGFVLFGVHESKRLQNACLRLAQIDVAVYKDDDSFFDEINVQYRKLCGFLRPVFSIWVFQTCEFIMFHKSNPNEIMPGPQEMPTPENRDYKYNVSRNPPILSTVFNANFYGCDKACIKSQLDLLCLLHQCKGRNHCGKFRVLERLPKRRRKSDIDRDEEVEEAWGLNTVFAVSFFRVILYHLLILVGTIVFWGLWLKKWPSDWQNASVPFFAAVVLLSLFWIPLVHNGDSMNRSRTPQDKSIWTQNFEQDACFGVSERCFEA